MVTAETEASWCCATMKTGDGYLRGAGAGGPDPGGELVVADLAVIQPAVDQAHRHRVLLPRESAGVSEALRARQGVSYTTGEIPFTVWTPESMRFHLGSLVIVKMSSQTRIIISFCLCILFVKLTGRIPFIT